MLSLAASGEQPRLSWLDGGPHGRSVVGVQPREELRSDDLEVLAALEDGHWIGWLSYEAGVDAALGRPPRSREVAGVCLRRFDGLLSFGPDGAESLGQGGDAIARALAQTQAQAEQRWPLQRLVARMSPSEYRRRVEVARREIAAGNTYQVNLSQPLLAEWTAAAASEPLSARIAALYGRLRTRTPATMGGLLLDADQAWVSNSPETLLRWRGDEVCSSPIKGTRPRGATPSDDEAQAQALVRSAKDAAEHVMIVDLVRNDLGQIASPGSVRTTARPRLVSLPTVHHLVTDVRARVPAAMDPATLIRALFPGGSITGAPKRRTLEIIERLETEPRGLYCGALLLATPDELVVSIAIRTGRVDAQGLRVHGGGGIVIDSEPEAERLETLAKVRAFDPHA